MFIMDQNGVMAYRADRIIAVRVRAAKNGFRDGWVYATIDGLPTESREVELGIYDNLENANQAAKLLMESVDDGYPHVFYMPEHNWWETPADAEDKAYTGTMEDEPYSDEDLDRMLSRMLMNAKPDNAP